MSAEVSYPVSLDGGVIDYVRLFPDDTIETIRMRVGMVLDIHPDRLRIYVQAELPADYYTKDSRRWEELFLRMSPEGKPIGKRSLDIYASYTTPAWTFEGEFDKSAWMLQETTRESEFQELRLLGAPEETSWVLPLDYSEPPFLPPAAKLGVQSKSLLQSLHPSVVGFRVLRYVEGLPPQAELLYFPFLRSGSPATVPDEIARSIRQQSKVLLAVGGLGAAPVHQSVMRIRWKLPLVNTDFGHAPRNRFEQIFYGTTVSPTTPTMSFFGSRQEQSRHKFYTASPNPKTPSLDLRLWSYWWGATKPSKNKPALLFYRGEGRFIYDRITINATEVVISCQRSDTSTDTIEQLQASMKTWIESIDGLSAFLDKADFDNSRWVIQDLSASLRYHTPISEADFRRFDCLRTIYEVVDHDKLLFKLLRSDQADIGLSPAELRTLQLLRENEGLQASELAEELEITVDDAGDVLGSIRDKLVDTPDILDKQFSNLPTFKFTASGATVTYAIDLPRIVRYISILREILANPTDSKLDDVCPRRVETVGTAVADIPVVELGEDDGLDFLDELLGEIADIGVVAAAEVKDAPKQAKKVQAKGASNSLATYLLNQLREFDSETYDPDDTQILRKCDRPRQPIVLTPAEMEGLRGGDYDPTITSASVLDVSDPDGHIICPEFWCTHDRIPLTADQLGDPKKCPVCGGGVRSKDASVEKTQDVVQFPVIQRDSTIIFPGYVKYKSKKNGKQIPCCFTTKQTTKIGSTKSDSLTAAEAYYVLGETKAQLGSLRLGYIPRIVGRALGIPLKYTDTISAGNRIQTGQSGFYRVGVGHAAETLPNVLGVPGKIRTPAQNPEVTLRCSFFRSWKGAESGNDIEARIASIDKAFKSKELSSIEELEYTALALECQLFVLYIVDGTVQVGCFMNIGAVRSVNRSVAVMVTEGDPEYICNVARITTVPQFTANLHKVAIYPPEILKTLTTLRGKACTSDIPTIDDTFVFINSMPSLKNKVPEMKVILDPYKRAQALFIPELVFLPFKPTSQIPTFLDEKVVSLSDIPEEELPYKGDILDFLAEAVRFHPGFEYAHDLSNRGRVTEVITRSGLRIPVQSEDTANGGEIVETVRANTEEQLVWGKPDKASEATKRTITYEAELFDFLLYQLSHDIQGEDYRGLRTALSADHPDIDELEPLLKAWIDDTLTFTEADVPPAFVRKLRSPCSTGNCSGSLCAWDGASCRVEVKRVRDSLQRAPLERRLLNTLLTNDKIRNVVWEHRSSPFFSSVLYLEAPTELILSDTDVSKRLK